MTKISIKELKTISLKKGVCYIKKDEEDFNKLNEIGIFIDNNRKKLSLSHLKFICEYLNDKMKNL